MNLFMYYLHFKDHDCLQVISVWLMAVLVMHLDKKLSLASETLTDTKDKLQLIQNSDASRRYGLLWNRSVVN